MMANPEAGNSLRYLRNFADAGLTINAQLVLCPGINDGSELIYSLEKLFDYYPSVGSIACVPVGLTKHRDGLCPLKPYDAVSAGEVIDIIDSENEKFKEKTGVKIAYASDEFYIIAGRDIPPAEYYDDFPQLDNGVGMWALLKSEFEQALEDCAVKSASRKVTVATGTAAYPLISELCALAQSRIPGLEVKVIPVVNNLFGESVTVSGLLSGEDIYDAVKNIDIGDELIIPPNCLRNEGDMFIDNMTVEQLSDRLAARIRQNKNGGAELLSALLGE
jgi:putative radical SAM enzyme (TIGR03279 family)